MEAIVAFFLVIPGGLIAALGLVYKLDGGGSFCTGMIGIGGFMFISGIAFLFRDKSAKDIAIESAAAIPGALAMIAAPAFVPTIVGVVDDINMMFAKRRWSVNQGAIAIKNVLEGIENEASKKEALLMFKDYYVSNRDPKVSKNKAEEFFNLSAERAGYGNYL